MCDVGKKNKENGLSLLTFLLVFLVDPSASSLRGRSMVLVLDSVIGLLGNDGMERNDDLSGRKREERRA